MNTSGPTGVGRPDYLAGVRYADTRGSHFLESGEHIPQPPTAGSHLAAITPVTRNATRGNHWHTFLAESVKNDRTVYPRGNTRHRANITERCGHNCRAGFTATGTVPE
ncbi:hypothetical protein [Amycolatopsis sp. H20-H5]|uniref:hypothetical protein n=1 Tax=Amycolatopsis sp. H20-H5 TaxID=3046309 RepID=UPI002DBF880F|nr:hypothetical protein [Amycolatopsis sp. H20-H5]MEC3974211.1 hypothetical protein [Amycolatopsis sp. H20-H5]